ncbi:MAG: alkaline phosphatase PhoX, partial [Cyanobium sp.]
PAWVTHAVLPGSLSPEGLSFLEARNSPSGRAQIVVANEVSNTQDILDFEALLASAAPGAAGSFTPTMIRDLAGGPNLQVTSLITVGEVTNGLLPGSSVYVAPGIFDGMGVFDNNDGTFSLLVNHELGNTAGSQMAVAGLNPAVAGARVSRFIVAKDSDNNAANGYQPRVLSGGLAYDRVVSSDPAFAKGGFNRFCSANLAPAGQFSCRGFSDSLFLLGEETSNGRFFVLDPASRSLVHVPAFGLGGWESATLVDTGNANTVAALLFDDSGGAVLYLWVGQKQAGSADLLERNGLAASSGRLYAWKADAISPNPDGLAGVALNAPVAGGWVELGSGSQIAALTTAAAQRSLATAQGAMTFTRIEDGDVNPLSGRQVVFNSTGGSGTDLYGSTYGMDLAASFGSDGLLLSGPATTPLRVLVDSDRLTGLDRQNGLRNPDNVVWAGDGQIYLQEDRSLPSGSADGAFGAQEASIWKLDPITGATSRWAQIDRSAVPTAYGQSDSAPADIGNWESSGILDLSPIYGAAPGSMFLANVQAHSLSNGNILGSGYLVEGGQLVVLQAALL